MLVVRGIQITYKNKQVQRYFDDYNLMKRKTEHTIIIKRRMDQLKAATSFADYLKLNLGNPHTLYGNLANCYGVSITGNVRLIIRPICEDLTPPTLEKCEIVMVKGVGDYHGNKINWFIP